VRKGLIILLSVLLAHSASSQKSLSNLLATSPGIDISFAEHRINNLIDRLEAKKNLSDINFLRKVCNETRRKFLKTYVQYTDMSEVFTSGKYDCLTATSLYSIVLDRLNFDYRIIETNYHIFLVVNTSRGEVLLETTDPWNGFVTDSKKIEQRIANYKQNTVTSLPAKDKKFYLYHLNLYHSLRQNQLPGLLYFNQAVRAYNSGEWEKCSVLLDRAQGIYDSPRIAELVLILVESVKNSAMEQEEKKRILGRYKNASLYDVTIASR
jgi:hypothetical protein